MNVSPLSIPTLIRPKLILQAFHLRKARTSISDAEVIWESLSALAIPLGIPKLHELSRLTQHRRERIDRSHRSEHRQDRIIPLLADDLNKNILRFDLPAVPNSPAITGGIYPLSIHDSYVVDLTCCYEAKIAVAELGRRLNPQGCLLPSQIKASIGQTLILFGQPVDWPENETEFAQEAENCAIALLQDAPLAARTQLHESGRGKFLGGSIFEFESEHPDPTQRYHLVIWLDDNADTAKLEASGDYYHAMLQLWLSRSKIQWSAYQSKLAYAEANKLYEFANLTPLLLDRLQNTTEERLNNLEGWLLEMQPKTLQYAERIWDIQNQLTTITINTDNLIDRLNQLKKLSIKNIDDLTFLEQFSSQDCQTDRKQVAYDLEYVTINKNLFSQRIETIRGLVEIEGQRQQIVSDRAERTRDRNTTILVAMVGSGLAVSGISAQIKPTAAKDALNYFNITFNEITVPGAIELYIVTIIFHATVGIIFAFLIKWIAQRFSRYS